MFKNKATLSFYLGIYASLSGIILFLSVVSYFYGYIPGSPIESFADICYFFLGIISLFTIPAMLVLGIVYEMTPKKLKESFYKCYLGRHRCLFTLGVTIPVAMIVVTYAVYTIIITMTDGKSFIHTIIILLPIYFVPPLLIKLFVVIGKKREKGTF